MRIRRVNRLGGGRQQPTLLFNASFNYFAVRRAISGRYAFISYSFQTPVLCVACEAKR